MNKLDYDYCDINKTDHEDNLEHRRCSVKGTLTHVVLVWFFKTKCKQLVKEGKEFFEILTVILKK
jgi:hypothetical protein